MKFTLVSATLAAVATANAYAADVKITGAMAPQTAAGVDVRIASKDLLNNPTALLNKNTLAMDNNVFIARSNVVFTQNDRLALREKVNSVVQSEQAMATATLTKDVMRAVSAPDSDSALMTKASAVVAAKGDPSALTQRIADFVDAVGQKEVDQEQAIQSQTPNGVIILVGTKDILRQPTGVVNKNMAASDNQIAISRSNIAPTANDQIVLAGGAKVADAVLPAANLNVGQVKTEVASEPLYRQKFVYPEDGEADAKLANKEQWGLWGGGCGGGWGCGWRYPLGYWNTWGAGIYGGGCGLGFPYGGFYYC